MLAVGCLALWLGVPAGGLWLAAQVTVVLRTPPVLALAFIVAGMALVAIALSWVNDLYLRVSGGRMVLSAGQPVRRRGPLEPMLVATLALAILSFALWFLLIAENPTINVY